MKLTDPVLPEVLNNLYKLMQKYPQAIELYIKYLNRVDPEMWTPSVLCQEYQITRGVMNGILSLYKIIERRKNDRRMRDRRTIRG